MHAERRALSAKRRPNPLSCAQDMRTDSALWRPRESKDSESSVDYRAVLHVRLGIVAADLPALVAVTAPAHTEAALWGSRGRKPNTHITHTRARAHAHRRAHTRTYAHVDATGSSHTLPALYTFKKSVEQHSPAPQCHHDSWHGLLWLPQCVINVTRFHITSV